MSEDDITLGNGDTLAERLEQLDLGGDDVEVMSVEELRAALGLTEGESETGADT